MFLWWNELQRDRIWDRESGFERSRIYCGITKTIGDSDARLSLAFDRFSQWNSHITSRSLGRGGVSRNASNAM